MPPAFGTEPFSAPSPALSSTFDASEEQPASRRHPFVLCHCLYRPSDRLLIHSFDPLLAIPAAVIAASGYLSHLVADLVSPSGMFWLWPIVRRPVRPGWFPKFPHNSFYGQVLEGGVILLILCWAVIWFFAIRH